MISSLAIALVLSAGPAVPVAGEYIADGGRGLLVLGKNGKFKLDVAGANGHSCSMEGTWTGASAAVKDDACRLNLRATDEGIEVTSNTDDACRAWCGARASYDALFLKPTPECVPAAVKKARDAFKVLYVAKKWVDAAAQLSPLLPRCERVIDRFEVLWIRNDLALTQHHAGDDAGCLKTLEPAGDLRILSDEDAGGSEPAYEDIMKKLTRATRTNATLCGFKSTGAKK